jgi:hypothetical protein
VSRKRPDLMQGDIVELDGAPHVIVSRSCDLPRDDPPRAMVAPLVDDASKEVAKRLDPRRVSLPARPGEHADMTRARTVDKSELPEVAAGRGCRTADEVRRFREDAGRYLDASSLPAGVNDTVDPMWQHMRKKRDAPGYEEMLEAIKDVRVRFRPDHPPDDGTSDRSMTLIFVIDAVYDELLPEEPAEVPKNFGKARDGWLEAETLADRASALDGYCRLLAERCSAEHPVVEVDVEVVAETSFSYSEYFASDALRIEALSP